MKKIKVKLQQNPYNIFVCKDCITQLREVVEKEKYHSNILAVIDKNIYTIYKKKIEQFLTPPMGKFTFLQLDASESKKSLSAVSKIYSSLVLSNYGRDTLILAIGGGIIGDVAGFAAATYARGVQYIQVPTTLLAAVDSSVGGKTGVNFGDTKNIIGAFYQPKAVLVDTSFFGTLPKSEIISGMGEVIKYAFLTDKNFFDYVSKNFDKIIELDDKVITKVISESVSYKGDVVVNDERETSGVRKILNLGHTFAHAIEVDSKHRIKHGAAVIVGIGISLFLSHKLGIMKEKELEQGIELIKKASTYIKVKNYSIDNMLKIMKRDKKSMNEQYRFVLTKEIGKILVDMEAENDDIIYAIKEGMKLFE